MVGVEGTYNDKVVRQFAVMTVVWGIVGMLVGVLIASTAVLAASSTSTYPGSATAVCGHCIPMR